MRKISNRCAWVVAGWLATVQGVTAEDHVLHEWGRIQLQTNFYSEGAGYGDFNKDGVMDVVAGPFWYEGPDYKNIHEYYKAEPFDKNTYSRNFFAFGDDIDKDGWDDILIVGFPGEESWWFKNPGGKDGQWARHVIDDFVGNESIPYVDIDGDGVKELVYLNKRGQYGYSKPDPADPTKKWNFTAISPVSNFGKFTHGQGVGDVNGDGRLDILEMTGWWEQPPPGTEGFWKKHDFRFSNLGGAHMYAYDFDGDGDNDIVTSLAAHQYGLAWYEQVMRRNLDKAFIQHVILKERPEPNEYGVSFSQLHAVELVDMDNDGILDIVTGKRHWAHNGNDPDERGPAVLYWFKTVRTDKGVDFIPYLIDDDSGIGTQVTVADLNGDGLQDVIVGNKLGTFVHIHKVRKVSKEEWEAAQPKKKEEAKADASSDPKNRLSGLVPKGADGQPLNLDFEQGSLADWTVVDGDAFTKQPVNGDNVARRRKDMRSRHEGTFWIGTYEGQGDGPQGILSSKSFPVTHRFATFLIGGGAEPSTRVELVENPSQTVIFKTSAANTEDMRPVLVDLTTHKGKEIFVRLVDQSSNGWGHLNFDDFRFHDEKPVLENELVVLTANEFAHAGLSAEEAAKAMDVPKGFRVDVIAAEPDVRQPIAMTIDERGRIWIAEAFEYPFRAPEGKGKDRVLIFEDADGNGTFETRKVFAEGLNLVSGIEVGYGGLFVGAAPYLLFYADADRDDRADGEPEVLLDGWAYQDTHETLNSFIWGPDGWLYGCHGVFTHSNVGRPGASDAERQRINAGIWRYHPTKKTFEVFAHGTSNPWGVDFNDHGQCFLTCCVIPHLFHVIEGARYERQAGEHFNPYTFADIPTVAKHRHWLGVQPHAGNNFSAAAGGGHAHAGAMFYLGGSWPKEYRDQLFMNNIHGSRINVDAITPKGSGYVGDRAPDFLVANDLWSQIVYLRSGPDGQVYVIDWYDANQCHRIDRTVHDQSNGRIFRIAIESAKPAQVDLSKATDEDLVDFQTHDNDWYCRTARRLLAERSQAGEISKSAMEKLRSLAVEHKDDTRRLRGFWALHAISALTARDIDRALADASPYIRGFAIQFAVEGRQASEEMLEKFTQMASEDPSPIVRLYLASAADRLPTEHRWELLTNLVGHSDDASDHNLPLLYWYAAEPLGGVDASRAMDLALKAQTPRLLEFMSRRIASGGKDVGLALVVERLSTTEDESKQRAILTGVTAALAGRRNVDMPSAWPTVVVRLASAKSADITGSVRSLSVKFGDAKALAGLRELARDAKAEPAQRRSALESLLAVKDPKLVETLYELLTEERYRDLAIRGLAGYFDADTPRRILSVYKDLSLEEKKLALATLSSRAPYSAALLEAVGTGVIPAADLGGDVVRQIRSLNLPALNKRLTEVWGVARETSEDKATEIEQYRKLIAAKKPAPDIHLGRAVFAKTCATCHELFGSGSNVGPGLTGSNRKELNYILENILDPSAVMAKEYQPHVILTSDGRTLNGIVKATTDTAITVRTATEELVIPKDEIDEMKLSDKSMMPDDQWRNLSDHEIRSLVAYLASPSQVPLLATAQTAESLFNGRDLTGWSGNKELWSVENGELVGKSPGLKRNEFLASDLLVGDFRLNVKVKLTPNEGNSGIQFRSEMLSDGEMRGCQADIGVGWWGKLYEESGRGLLWDKSGEKHVRPGDWNDYEIFAQGSRIKTWINGRPCVDLDDSAVARKGVLALQIHAGPAMEVRFKDFVLEVDTNSRTEARR